MAIARRSKRLTGKQACPLKGMACYCQTFELNEKFMYLTTTTEFKRTLKKKGEKFYFVGKFRRIDGNNMEVLVKRGNRFPVWLSIECFENFKILSKFLEEIRILKEKVIDAEQPKDL